MLSDYSEGDGAQFTIAIKGIRTISFIVPWDDRQDFKDYVSNKILNSFHYKKLNAKIEIKKVSNADLKKLAVKPVVKSFFDKVGVRELISSCLEPHI